jgi:hypothetical protein
MQALPEWAQWGLKRQARCGDKNSFHFERHVDGAAALT